MIEHDWEEVPFEPRSQTVSEFDVPSKDDPSLLQRMSLRLDLSFVRVRKVGVDDDGKDKLELITSQRKCRSCGQESTNGEEPPEPCGPRQVRRVMEE